MNHHHSDSLWNLDLVDQYRSLAEGYLFAAITTCEVLAGNPSQVTFSRSAACHFNARLSVELFLKALILKRQGSIDATHHIENLCKKFNELYPELTDIWDIPFCVEFLGFDDVVAAQKDFLKEYQLDQILRYPTNKLGKPWSGVLAIEPNKFLDLLCKIKSDIEIMSTAVFS